MPRRLHRLLADHAFYPLAGSSLVACALAVAVRWVTQNGGHRFLGWNLLLAWVPYLCGLAVAAAPRDRGGWRLFVPTLGWLLFFPNAPYIVTDFVHLEYGEQVWYDACLIAAFAWTGLLLGLVSLRIIHDRLNALYGQAIGWAAVLASAGLGGFGIYVGRVLRWNSWHVLTRPAAVFGALGNGLLDPLAHARALGISGAFAVFVLVTYLTFLNAGRRQPYS